MTHRVIAALLGSIAVLAPTWSPSPVHAHGELPAARAVFLDAAGAPTGIGATYGLVLVEDGVPRWTCEETVADLPRWYHRRADGAVLIGTPSGILRTGDGGCSWSRVRSPLDDHHVAALAADPADARHVFVVTATSGAANGVYESRDDGATWTSRGPDANLFFLSLAVAPGGARLAALGFDATGVTPALLASDDAGVSWAPVPVDWGGASDALLLGHDATGDALLAGVRDAPAGGDRGGRLVAIDPATGAVHDLAAFPGQPTAHARLGADHFVALDRRELWRARADGAYTLVPDGPPRCLVADPAHGALWACAHLRHGANLLVTRDGDTWTPALPFTDLAPRACAPGTPGATACPTIWPLLAATWRPAGPSPSPSPSLGQGCHAATVPVPAAVPHAAWLLLPILLRRPRRPRRRAH
jgi:hypothetical protein